MSAASSISRVTELQKEVENKSTAPSYLEPDKYAEKDSSDVQQDVEKSPMEAILPHNELKGVKPSKLRWSFSTVAFIITALLYGK